MAYTKYSLTPANNTAAPPDGAPEGMLPSAVNDTMRDMMAQIRDVGDGVRDGTYTMTAPKITGGTITGVTLTGNTLTNPVITGATLTTSAFNGTVGATTASTGAFTTLTSNGATTFTAGTASTSTTTGTNVITGGLGVSGRINAANFDGIVGANTAAAGSFTTVTSTTGANFATSSGSVGIGTSSPSAALSVIASPMVNQLLIGASTADSGYGSISFNGTSGATRIGFTGGGTGDPNLYYDAATSGIHQFRVNNAIKMVLDSNGNLLLGPTTARANAGDVQVSKGISFPATQSAQSDANTLDDYEEGTWTPSLGGNTTYNGQSGNYIKIGKMVYVEGNVFVNSIGTGSTSLVSGLPFTSATQAAGARATLSVNYFNSTASNVTYIALYLNSAATTAQFQGIAAAGTTMSTIGIFGNSTDVYFSGCYYASS